MFNIDRRNRCRALALAGALLLMGSATGCDALLDAVSGRYRGPRPAEERLDRETVIVRRLYPSTGVPDQLILDRVRYLEGGDEHNVNRIVEAFTVRVRSEVTTLDLKPGDRLVVTTEFSGITEKGELPVPDWPGHGYDEYPVGVHTLTAIARAP